MLVTFFFFFFWSKINFFGCAYMNLFLNRIGLDKKKKIGKILSSSVAYLFSISEEIAFPLKNVGARPFIIIAIILHFILCVVGMDIFLISLRSIYLNLL